MRKLTVLKVMAIVFITITAHAEEIGSQIARPTKEDPINLQATTSNSQEAFTANKQITTLEFEYRLLSPEILFHVGDDSEAMTPKNAGQPGLRYSKENISVAFNKSFLSTKSQSGGLDLAYSWDNSYIQVYHICATG